MNILSTVKTHRVSLFFGILGVLTFLALAVAVVIAWPSLRYLIDSLLK